jgi:sugar lactone lactonase YvrE
MAARATELKAMGRRVPAGWGPISRRSFLVGLAAAAGCVPGGTPSSSGELELVWGRHGLTPGRFHKPRAIAIDREDRLYIVDMTARIQVFDREGSFLREWQTPTHEFGRPTGMTVVDDRVLVADTHYFQVLIYSLTGQLRGKLGGQCGTGPGQFGLVTDVVRDPQGRYLISEYGDFDRIQVLSPEGDYLFQFGGQGDRPGEFLRPQSLAWDEAGMLWVADACNHRVQQFAIGPNRAELVRCWGTHGMSPQQLRYPYGIVAGPDRTVYVCEWGNARVQRWTEDGRVLGSFGRPGREPGALQQPWSLVRDSRGRLSVLDSLNHRVQRIVL